MTSTRTRNLPGDYAVRKRINSDSRSYQTYHYKAYAPKDYFPAMGINVGQAPNGILAVNQTDVGSFLRGQYFSNLEEPKKQFTAETNSYPSLAFFGRRGLIMPNPLAIENCQRPYRYASSN
jgi:hypothetical protein